MNKEKIVKTGRLLLAIALLTSFGNQQVFASPPAYGAASDDWTGTSGTSNDTTAEPDGTGGVGRHKYICERWCRYTYNAPGYPNGNSITHEHERKDICTHAISQPNAESKMRLACPIPCGGTGSAHVGDRNLDAKLTSAVCVEADEDVPCDEIP